MPGGAKTLAIDGLSEIRIDRIQNAAVANQIDAIPIEQRRRDFGYAAMQRPDHVTLGDVPLPSRSDRHEIRLSRPQLKLCSVLTRDPTVVS